MTIIQAIILSIVEGITEFLPISSTGHLILVSRLLNISQTDFVKSFEIFIQLGAILAVVVLYFQKIWNNKKSWGKIITAFIPTGILGLIFYNFVKNNLLGNPYVVVISLFLGGIAILILEKIIAKRDASIHQIEDITYPKTIAIGTTQSLAMIPGVSRSLSTIFGGLLMGLNRSTATEFSFFLAIPTMFSATALDLIKSSYQFTTEQFLLLAVGFIFSFIFALLSVRFLINFVKKHSFRPFAYYRIILAIAFLVLL
ncbi:undecaprenyl-diphosphate phosphatase [Candidatus Shapirobacteria bacterium]|nr:undecaprenyl-diphosphate phosphatase [Candidatus Shapirobacteria bacterium]